MPTQSEQNRQEQNNDESLSTLSAEKDNNDPSQLDEKLDKFFDKLGGFGLYQLFLSFTFLITFFGAYALIVMLSYLTKVPQQYFCTYEGSSEAQICTPADFCSDPTVTSYEPNMDLADSYYNWILKYDLHCASKMKIGIIGSVPFIGWVSTLLFIPRLADVYGRYKIILIGNIVQLLALTMTVFTRSFPLLIVGLLITGMTSSIRVQVSVLFMYENMSRANYQRFYIVISVIEACLAVVGVLYFKYLTKDWIWLGVMALIMQIIGTVNSCFLEESPRYLIKSGQIDLVQQVFEKIASFNSIDKQVASKSNIDQLFCGKSSENNNDIEDSQKEPEEIIDEDERQNLIVKSEDQPASYTKVKTPDVKFFLKQRIIWTNLILLTTIWVVVTFNFYMINLQIKYLPGDFENNMLAMYASDIPAGVFAGLMLRQGFSPKRLMASYMLFSAIAALQMVIFVDIDNSGVEMPILTACAHMGVVASFTTLYMTHPDFFPTLFSVTSMGIANFACRSFVIFAPLIAEIDYPSPMILFTALQMVAFLSALFVNDDIAEIKKVEKTMSKQMALEGNMTDLQQSQLKTV